MKHLVPVAIAAAAAALAAAPAHGAVVVTTLGTTGTAPTAIALDSAGNAFTTNWAGNSVSKVLAGGGAAAGAWPVTVGTGPWGIGIDAGNIRSVVDGEPLGGTGLRSVTPGGRHRPGTRHACSCAPAG